MGAVAGLVVKRCSVFTKRLGDPSPTFIVVLATASFNIMALISLADKSGFAPMYKAATPATCGLAMDVPLIVFVAVSLVNQVDVMSVP